MEFEKISVGLSEREKKKTEINIYGIEGINFKDKKS